MQQAQQGRERRPPCITCASRDRFSCAPPGALENEVKLGQPRIAGAKAESSACQKLAFAILPSISAPNILRPTAYFDLCWNLMERLSSVSILTSVCSIAEPRSEGHRVREAYGINYDRLVALKAKFDPTNFFRCNQNIPPR